MAAKSKAGPIAMIVGGTLLAAGPILGVLGTVMGMTRAFGRIAEPQGASAEQLAGDISLSMWTTFAGLVMYPLGLGLLIGGAVWLGRRSTSARSLRPSS